PLILKKWNPDVNSMKEDVVNVPVWVKLYGVPITAFTKDVLSAIATDIGTLLMLESYTSNMCIQSWGRSSYSRALIEIQADVKLKDTIVVAMPKLIGEGFYTCTVQDSNQQKKYRPVAKKPTANASGNKKKCEEPIKEVSNSNPFGVLNSVVNDEEFGTNGGLQCWLATGPILVEPRSGMLKLVVDYLNDHDSDDEVYSVDNDMTRYMATERVGFGTQRLLDQWRDSYENDDYDEDPYDDDMHE
nr:hypothetical protein [Tanacetum cinerariifolium]